jgi:hypothetical protein
LGHAKTAAAEDRLNDALNATKAALEEGIVPGGGDSWGNGDGTGDFFLPKMVISIGKKNDYPLVN